jgi:hypothetical protein
MTQQGLETDKTGTNQFSQPREDIDEETVTVVKAAP